MHTAITHTIHWVPYDHRPELCSIGVLVFLPHGEVQAYVTESLRKVKAMDPSVSQTALRETVESLAKELTHNPSFWAICKDGLPHLRFSGKPGVIRYEDETQLRSGINWSMKVAVEPVKPKKSLERDSVSRLFLDIKRTFENMGWMAALGVGIDQHRIVPRYAVIQDEGLVSDFALKAQTLELFQVVDFRNPSDPARRLESQSKAYAIAVAKQTIEKAMGYAIVAGSSKEQASKGLRTLERVSDDVFIYESSEDMNRLFEHVGSAIGSPPLPDLTLSVQISRLTSK